MTVLTLVNLVYIITYITYKTKYGVGLDINSTATLSKVDETTFPQTVYAQSSSIKPTDDGIRNSIPVTTMLSPQQTYDKEKKKTAVKDSNSTGNDEIEYYLNFTNVADDMCYAFGSCERPLFSQNSVEQWYCKCDERCEEFNDCCLAYNKTQKYNISNIYGCIRRCNVNTDMFGFTAIIECPWDYDNDSIREKCNQDNMVDHGTLVVDGNGVIYKNIFCASCHRITNTTSFDIQFFNFKMSDRYRNFTRKEKIQYLLSGASYLLKPPPDLEFRSCIGDLIVNEDPRCRHYVNPIIMGFRLHEYYRNYFCIPDDKRNLSTMACFAHFYSDRQIDEIYNLTVTFSFKKTAIRDIGTTTCDQWSLEMMNNPSCSQLETYTNFEIEIEYYLVTDLHVTLEDMIKYSILSVWSFEIENLSELIYNVQIQTIEQNTISKIRISLKILKRSFFHEIGTIENRFCDRNIYITVKDNRKNDVKHVRSRQVIPNDRENTTLLFTSTRSISLWRTTFSQTALDGIFLQNHSMNKLTREITINVRKESDGMIYIDSINHRPKSVNTKSATYLQHISVVTYVCFSVSVFSLFGLIIYNRRCSLVLSIADTNLENICVSLLLSNVLFMLGIGAYNVRRLCYAIGIILHYLSLSVFTYMTISVLHIAIKIIQMKSRTTQDNEPTIRRKRRIVTVIGLLIPLVFVGPAVAVDKLGPVYLSPGYAEGYAGKTCFPNRSPANVIFFSGPVLISLTVNLVCLVTIVAKIYSVRMGTKRIRKSEPYRDAKMYLRIVLLSGVFWIIGFLSRVFKSQEFDYIFTVLCGLQGFLIAVANLTTTKLQCRKTDSFSTKETEISREPERR